jgi:hypothetical protein
MDEAKPVKDWIQNLYTSIRPTQEQLAQDANTKYRESLAYPTRNITAWFDKWEDAMASAEKYKMFGIKGMWINDIYNVWKERFPHVAERLHSEYTEGSIPDVTYMQVSQRFRRKLDMEAESRRTGRTRGSMRGSTFLAADSDEPTFIGEGVQEDENQHTGRSKSKRGRATTTTGTGPNKKRTKKEIDLRPCVGCRSPYRSIKICWFVIGAPEGRYLPEEKKEFEKRRKDNPEFDKLVQAVLKLKMDNSDDAQ